MDKGEDAAGMTPPSELQAVRDAARNCALQRGLEYNDAEDCAAEFAETMLQRSGRLQHQRRSGRYHAWLRRCALNYVEDFCRRRATITLWETPWPQKGEDTNLQTARRHAYGSPPVDADLLRGEFGERLMRATTSLAAAPRDLFLRYHLGGESLSELAAQTGRTPDAVGKVLKRARVRVRAALEQQGVTEAEANDYLAAIRSTGGG